MVDRKVCPQCNRKGNETTCPIDGYPMVNESQISPHADTIDFTGKIIDGRYKILKRIGAGAMGWVFQGQHLNIGHEVALKVMRKNLGDDLKAVRRFFLEARACSQLQHPHTIKVHDFGTTDDGYLYLAMEFLSGRPLSKLISAEAPLEPERAINIAIQVCQSLDEAHDAGIVHRDLKPDNIFICDIHRMKDYVKVLDFGIAKVAEKDSDNTGLTHTGMVVGTPNYLSPEQAKAEPVDRRSDLYSLGVILYRMLLGKLPFEAGSLAGLLVKILNEPPPALPEEVNEKPIGNALRSLVARCLQKEQDKRPNSAAEVEDRLRKILENPNIEDDQDEFMSTMLEVPAPVSPPPRPPIPTTTSSSVTVQSRPPLKEEDEETTGPEIELLSSSSTDVKIEELSLSLMKLSTTLINFKEKLKTHRLKLMVGGGLLLVLIPLFIFALSDKQTVPQSKGGLVVVSTDNHEPAATVQAKGEEGRGGKSLGTLEDPDEKLAKAELAQQKEKEAMVRVVSQPVGATVKSGDSVLGHTPMDLNFTNRVNWQLVLEHKGYKSKSVRVEPSDASEVLVELERIPTPTRRVRKPTRRPQTRQPQKSKPQPPKEPKQPTKQIDIPYDL